MKYILITLVCLFSLQLSAQKGSFYLTNVDIILKDKITYQYQDGTDIFRAIIDYQDGHDFKESNSKTDGNYTTLEITKNKVHYFSITRDKAGKPVYRIGKSDKMIGFNKKAYQLLPQEIKLILAYLAQDEREYQPQFNGGGNDNINTGIPTTLGPDIAAAADGGDDQCSQTGSCSCSNGQTLSVTCGCNYAITCDMREATICQSNADGSGRHCKTESRCAPRCAPLTD